MKKLLFFLLVFTNLFAVDTNVTYGYAAGVILGSIKGVNFLAYDGVGQGYQLTLSINNNKGSGKITTAFDKLFFYDANETIPVYAGVGVKLSDTEDKYIGIRGVFGISYFMSALSDSLEIYGEVAPTLYLTSIEDFRDLEFGIGARFYF